MRRAWLALLVTGCASAGDYNFGEATNTSGAGDMEPDIADPIADPADLAMHADAAVPFDLAAATDSLPFADLTIASDLSTPPDLAPVIPPSCKGLPRTCGGNGDCCEAPTVPGGMFNRSNDATYPATISTFRLDRYEVTVGRFREMLDAVGPGTRVAPPANGAGSGVMGGTGWDAAWNGQLAVDGAALKASLDCANGATWTPNPAGNEVRPINCVSWFEAFAFCIWDGGRLPTEAEWNYAATGGSEQRVYPWSNPPSATVIDDTYAVYCGGSCSSTRDVGSKSPKGDGRWGHADIAGNVWEPVLDWFAPYVNPCNDCAAVQAAQRRVVRGGSFADSASNQQTDHRPTVDTPDGRSVYTGIRCARGK